MTTTLLTTGLLCVIAAIVGGGIELLGGKVPIIHSPIRQIALGLFGLVLLVGAYVSRVPPSVPKDSSSSDPSGSPLPKLEGTTWAGNFTYSNPAMPISETQIYIVFGADTAVVSIATFVTFIDEYCSWAASGGTIRLHCLYFKTHGDKGQQAPFHREPQQFSINYVYELRVNGLSMSGTMHAPDDPNQDGSMSLLRKVD